MTTSFSVSDLCEVTGCKPPTLRAWRNRNGLFPRHGGKEGWTRYDMADGIGVMLMLALTERGLGAQPSVNIVNQLRDILVLVSHGAHARIAIGRQHGSDELEWRELKGLDYVQDAIGWFDDDIVNVINLDRLASRFFHKYRELKGIVTTSVTINWPQGTEK